MQPESTPALRVLESHYRGLYRCWPETRPSAIAVGYLCTYVPEELIAAAGAEPVRILPAVTDASLSQAHLQSYTCYLARACLHRALEGELDFMRGVVFAHTCDTMQGLADIWAEALEDAFVEVLNVPTTLNAAGVIPYLKAELERVFRSLCRHFGVEEDEARLAEAVKLVNRKRSLLAELGGLRTALGARGFFYAVNAAMTMPLREAISTLESLLRQARNLPPITEGVRLMVAGSTLDDPTILGLIEDAGGLVVADDLCNGFRYFATPTDETLPPVEAIAMRLLERPLCSCKFLRPGEYARRLADRAAEHRVRGVILVRQKFCDPWGWEHPAIVRALKERGIASLLLEIEQPGATGALATRIQAFVEMLRGEG